MYIPDFNYYRPKSLKEAINLLENSDNGVPIAGGTDLLVEIKQGLRNHDAIISLNEINELKEIKEDESNIYIGAGLTHNELINSKLINERIPSLALAASNIGSDQIRNKGTIGGNLCTAASCCDLGPILIALNASVEIANSKRTSNHLLNDFFIFHRKTLLKKDEIMTKIIIPKPTAETALHFEKFGLRNAVAVSVASVAVMIKTENNLCKNACVVIGAVAPVPKISKKSSDILIGIKISDITENSAILIKVGDAVAADARPLDDIRGSKEYRKNILRILTQRAILKVIEITKQTSLAK